MVDKEKIREKLDGSSDDGGGGSQSRKKRKAKEQKRGGSSEDEMTKEEKLGFFKGDKNETSESGDGTKDVKRLLFVLGNMFTYPDVMKKYEYDGFKKADTKIKEETADDIESEVMNFLGVFNVRNICDKYGYEWENVLEHIMNQDKFGRRLNTNPGDVDRGDVKELLDCIANCMLVAEGIYRDMEDKSNRNRKQTVKMMVAENIYGSYEDIVSEGKVQRIAEQNGFDWEEDVVNDILKNQDFEQKLKRHQ